MRRLLAVFAGLLAVGAGAWLVQPAAADLTVYCAHDSVYAAPFLARFTAETGISVQVRYDTEATKSLGLTEMIAAEREHPRCDVFWNNEPLGTVQLAEAGLLEPYRGAGFARIPAAYKDPDGRWVGFAGRLRVWILREGEVPEATVLEQVWRRPDLSGVAVARPLYGTTRSHFTALFEQLGPDGLRAFYRERAARGLQVVAGNAAVKNLVAAGRCELGWTDTDDFFVAKDAGHPVRMAPVRLPDGATLCVPNTVAIVAGCRNRPAAERLVDYLTSARAELELARSRSRQVPLGPVPADQVPADVAPLVAAAREGYVFRDVAGASARCLAWLKEEFLR